MSRRPLPNCVRIDTQQFVTRHARSGLVCLAPCLGEQGMTGAASGTPKNRQGLAGLSIQHSAAGGTRMAGARRRPCRLPGAERDEDIPGASPSPGRTQSAADPHRQFPRGLSRRRATQASRDEVARARGPRPRARAASRARRGRQASDAWRSDRRISRPRREGRSPPRPSRSSAIF